MISFKDYHVGSYCGERAFSPRSWRRNPGLRRTSSGFSVGPILFWRERIR